MSRKLTEAYNVLFNNFARIFVLISYAFIAMALSTTYSWEAMWARGLEPGQAFDAGRPEAALLAIIEGSGVGGLTSVPPVSLSGKRAFDPGCGRGYSLKALKEFGCESVLGLELAPTAVAAARESLAAQGMENSDSLVMEGDFFDFEAPEPFDLVYDCTFLCAIPPERRVEWATRMGSLLKSGGDLVTLIFPCREGAQDPADSTKAGPGPPYNMSPRLVEGLLLPAAFSLHSIEKVPSELVTRPFAGEYIARWTRT